MAERKPIEKSGEWYDFTDIEEVLKAIHNYLYFSFYSTSPSKTNSGWERVLTLVSANKAGHYINDHDAKDPKTLEEACFQSTNEYIEIRKKYNITEPRIYYCIPIASRNHFPAYAFRIDEHNNVEIMAFDGMSGYKDYDEAAIRGMKRGFEANGITCDEKNIFRILPDNGGPRQNGGSFCGGLAASFITSLDPNQSFSAQAERVKNAMTHICESHGKNDYKAIRELHAQLIDINDDKGLTPEVKKAQITEILNKNETLIPLPNLKPPERGNDNFSAETIEKLIKYNYGKIGYKRPKIVMKDKLVLHPEKHEEGKKEETIKNNNSEIIVFHPQKIEAYKPSEKHTPEFYEKMLSFAPIIIPNTPLTFECFTEKEKAAIEIAIENFVKKNPLFKIEAKLIQPKKEEEARSESSYRI